MAVEVNLSARRVVPAARFLFLSFEKRDDRLVAQGVGDVPHTLRVCGVCILGLHLLFEKGNYGLISQGMRNMRS